MTSLQADSLFLSPNPLSPEEFAVLHDFDAATRVPLPFNHRAHIYVTWLYLRRWLQGELSLQDVCLRMQRGLRRLAEIHGIPQKYHSTITQAAVQLVADAMRDDPDSDFLAWCARHAELVDEFKAVLARYYSDERLYAVAAREAFVAPDRQPLPQPE